MRNDSKCEAMKAAGGAEGVEGEVLLKGAQTQQNRLWGENGWKNHKNRQGDTGPTHSSSTCFMRTDTLQASLVTSLLGGTSRQKCSKTLQVTHRAGKSVSRATPLALKGWSTGSTLYTSSEERLLLILNLILAQSDAAVLIQEVLPGRGLVGVQLLHICSRNEALAVVHLHFPPILQDNKTYEVRSPHGG